MAIEVKVRTTSAAVLTDLRPGKSRKSIYSPAGQLGPWTIALLGLTAAALAPGVVRTFKGTSPRTKAREALEDELLASQITGAQEKALTLRTQRALLAREFDPISEEERSLKLDAIRRHLPLDLAQEEVSLERERALDARAEQLFPVILEERATARRTQEELGAERAERQVEFLQTERAKRELLAEETERASLLNEQLEQQNELIRSAIGPLDAAQAAQFARERLFPPGKREQLAPIGSLSVPRMTFATAGF